MRSGKNFSKSNYLKFLVNIQKARNFAREARVIETNESPSERRLERNEMDESNDLSQEKSDDELMSKLVQLAEMREKGVLSEEEFIMAKSKLLQL